MIDQQQMIKLATQFHQPHEASFQEMYESALAKHALRIKREQWLVRGAELGLVIPIWSGPRDELIRYVPDPNCDLWLDMAEFGWDDNDDSDETEREGE